MGVVLENQARPAYGGRAAARLARRHLAVIIRGRAETREIAPVDCELAIHPFSAVGWDGCGPTSKKASLPVRLTVGRHCARPNSQGVNRGSASGPNISINSIIYLA